MGSVWSAETVPQQGQALALKIILPRRLEGSEAARTLAVGRFMREAAAMTKLRSPHVAYVHGQGWDGELAFLVMDLLHGESLQQLLRRKRSLDSNNTMRLLGHVGHAMTLAHGHGIVHRDLKPGNIFLCRDAGSEGFVGKVLDFGLAKSLADPLLTDDPVMTRKGALLGTPFYMSPEQIQSKNIDHRCDLWAMAIIAFECLCGRKPFSSSNLSTLFEEICQTQAPRPSELVPVPRGFDHWFKRCIDPHPERRYNSAEVMIDELREALNGVGTPMSSGRVLMPRSNLGGFNTTGIGTWQEADFQRTVRIDRRSVGGSLSGRANELQRLDEFSRRDGGVVLISGPEGMGKTRLAREFVRDKRHWLCWLQGVAHESWAWLYLAAGLGVRQLEANPVLQIGRALRALGRAIVVLDGIDGVADALRPALAVWRTQAPEVLFILTATKRHGFAEQFLDLQPLASPPSFVTNIQTLSKAPAAALFLKRAIAYKRTLLGADDNATALAQLVNNLQGIPLAIEWVAGFARNLSLTNLQRTLAPHLANTGRGDVVQPPSALPEIFSWVWSQLDTITRAVLAQCAIFRGSFSLKAAEGIIDLSPFQSAGLGTAPSAYRVVKRLAQMGILSRSEPLLGTERYEMHPALQSFLEERLDAANDLGPFFHQKNSKLEFKRQHALFFASFGSAQSLQDLERRGGTMRATRHALELDNLRAGLGYALESNELAAAMDLACAIAVLLVERSAFDLAAETLEQVLSRSNLPAGEQVRTTLLYTRSLRESGRSEAAASYAQHTVQLAAQHGFAKLLCLAQCEHGRVLALLGRHEEATEGAGAALALAPSYNDDWLQLRVEEEACHIFRAASRPQQAIALCKAALERTADAPKAAAILAHLLADLEREQKNHEQALVHYELASQRSQKLGYHHAYAFVLGKVGEVNLDRGAALAGLQQLHAASQRLRELGNFSSETRFLGALAHAQALTLQFDKAEETLARADRLAESASPVASGLKLCRHALVHLLAREPEQARPLLKQVKRTIRRQRLHANHLLCQLYERAQFELEQFD